MVTLMRIVNGLMCAALVLLLFQVPVLAKSESVPSDRSGKQRYIVILDDLPLAAYDGRSMQALKPGVDSVRLAATATTFTGAKKLDVNSPASKQYLQYLDDRFESFRGEALIRVGRRLKPIHRYRNAVNGFATELSAAEVRALRAMPRVKFVQFDEIQHLQTDSGPAWIGADKLQDGSAGFPATGGEGVVVGIFDTGINWDHPSFIDPGEGLPPGSGGWDHVNPYDAERGLCENTEVLCNDKLVGVYDFVEDDPETEEIEEENNGKDNAGHGSHVASVVAGNPIDWTLSGIPVQVAGVAPHANIISYRVCYIADAANPNDDGCQTSAILRAIDQALTDGVDIINHSIGGDAHDPWDTNTSTYAFLSLRSAGIFVATATGNTGPNPGSVGSPENAPWVTAIGAATHDRVFASALENLSGGDTTPPPTLIGASSNDGVDIRKIVHAKDYGSALCGTGEPQSGYDCAHNTGASSPFAPGTFNGEIVVCDRGIYGRVEKGKNLLLAGAGGYVLANTEDPLLQNIIVDDLCLPSTHIVLEDADGLRTWLDSGVGHQASISGFSIFHVPEAGDVLASFSSRGPNQPPATDIMKPEMIAPGVSILGASSEGANFTFFDGTSFASPHVAGGAALIKSLHPDWTPSMIASALVMTATPEQAIDFDDSEATVNKIGSGRPRLDQAVNVGLYLNETEANFINADPDRGGKPRNLNLPGLIDTACFEACNFRRTVTDLVGGASWSASVEGVVDGGSVSITPNNFTLGNGTSQILSIDINLPQPNVGPTYSGGVKDVVGTWVYGKVRLTSDGLPDAVFPFTVYADGGELPMEWLINSDESSGWEEFELDDLIVMPDATFTSGGLVVPILTVESLPQDPNDSPYDFPTTGNMTVLHDVPAGSLWLHAETLASDAEDLDLYVGLDTNGDGNAQESEELCSSTSPTDIEFCDLFEPVAGSYWVRVQNWVPEEDYDPSKDPDEVTLKSAVVGKNSPSHLSATSDGIVPIGEAQIVRLSWDNVSAVSGTELLGAVGVGTRRETPNNIGIIPVSFTKTGTKAPETLVLMDGISRGLTIGAGITHDRIVVDIPPGTDSFTITTSATGNDDQQNEALGMELYRMNFDVAFADAPFAVVPNTDGDPLAFASGANDNGPTLTVSGADAIPGRWYVVLKNTSADDADVGIKVDLNFTVTPFPLKAGLWEPSSRPGINQGFDYATTGGYRAFLWYTYDEDGSPTWYLAAGLEPTGNVWVEKLERFTNDGTLQHESTVGYVSITTLGEEDTVFSFVLFGEEGTDRMIPISPPVCPTVNNAKMSYTGLWARPEVGVGGASAMVNEGSQGYLHYIYDARGRPVWLLGANVNDGLPHAEMPLSQYSGFCAVCSGDAPIPREVGTFTLDYTDEDSATWNLGYTLKLPLSGSVDRTDVVGKLTVPLICQ